MTKKDYVLIAGVMAKTLPLNPTAAGTIALREFASRLSDELERENPRFDRDTFYDACGIK